MSVRIAPARPEDCGTLFALVRALAEYERLSHLVVGSVEDLRRELFGVHPVIEAVLAWDGERAIGFALFFHNYSTFLARRGLYLEDLFVRPAQWIGRLFWKGGDGAVIDGLGPNGIAARVLDVTDRVVRLQTGYLYHYAFAMLLGIAALVTWMMLGSSF